MHICFARNARRLVASAVVAVLGCSSGPPTAPANVEFSLGIGDRVAIARTPLVLTFERLVDDSRCAPDVVCIWEGNAEIELLVRAGPDQRTLTLNTSEGPREGVVGSFRIALVSFSPPPASNVRVSLDYYRATLLVTDTAARACTEEARAGISVSVADSLTGSAQVTGLSVVAVDGAYRDSVYQAVWPGEPFPGRLGLAYERPGTYGLIVRADGYAPWTRAGIVVERDECHVITVPVTARLTR